MKKKINSVMDLVVYTVLFCTYILPVGIIDEGNYTLPKIIFVLMIGFIYVSMIVSTGRINKKELIFDIIIVLATVYTKNVNYLTFFTICFLEKIVQYKDDIIDILKKRNILYICLAFTILYSFLYQGTNDTRGRLAFAAIKEINQSGLSIFCLGIMLLIKNKKIAIFTLVFGCLTFSRSYYLAIICYVIFLYFSKIKIIHLIVKKMNYWNVTLISSASMVILGWIFIHQYNLGNITNEVNLSNRLYNFLDYSNFFRFQAIIFLWKCLVENPLNLFLGISDTEYLNLGHQFAKEMKLPFRGTPPHNLFYSHLKIYGIFSIIETLCISNILKKIVDNKNFGIYLGIVLYSIFLGAGLYSYWLYLSVFSLIIVSYMKNKEEVKCNEKD